MTVAVFGCYGRVGKKVVEILKNRRHDVVEIDIGTDVKNINCDVVIDFSSPAALDNIISLCKKNKSPLVCGTTGLTDLDFQKLHELTQFVKVDYRENFSSGVFALKKVLETLKLHLPNWDTEIVEIHRKGKIDSPSGTALSLAATLTDEKTRKNKKPFSSTTIHSLRVGSVFGTHTVIFAQNGETIFVTHNAENVDIFAIGAVEAAENLLRNPLGIDN